MSTSATYPSQRFETLRELSSFERRALIMAALLSGLLLWMIEFDVYIFGRFTEDHEHAVLASLEYASADVKRRPASIPVWQRADNAQSFYAKDQVFTGAKSKATLFFPAMNARLDLEENTLIVIDQSEQKVATKGWLSGVFGTAATPSADGVTLNVNGSKAKLSQDAVIAVRKGDDGELALNVYSGTISIVDEAGASQNIEANQRVALASDGAVQTVETIPFALLAPANDTVVRTNTHGTADIKFQWTLNNADSTPGTLQISAQADFRDLSSEYPIAASQSEQLASMSDGIYHWRLKSASGEYSESRQVTIQSFTAPGLLNPADHEIVQISEEERKTATINFSWSSRSLATTYELQVSEDEAFQNTAYSATSSSTSLSTDLALDKTFYWRVKALDAEGAVSTWSEPRSVVTKRVVVLPVLTGLDAKPNKFVLGENETTDVLLSWGEVANAETYEIELLRSNESMPAKEFSPTARTALKTHTLTVDAAGVYQWRVRALRGERAPITSMPEAFTIKAAIKLPPPVIPRKSQTRVVEYDLKVPSVTWSWTTDLKDAIFEVEVSQTPDFSEDAYTKNTTALRSFTVSLQQGEYYFRVRTLAANTSSAWSDTEQVSVKKVVVPDAPLLATFAPAKTIYFNESSPVFKARWQGLDAAVGYEVDVAHSTPIPSAVETSDVPAYDIALTDTATVKLRARARDKAGRVGYWSTPLVLNGIKTSDVPRAVYPLNHADLKLQEKESVTLTWAFSKPGFDRYVVKLGSKADLSDAKELSIKTDTNLPFNPDHTGPHYWQVLAYNDTGDLALGDIQTFNTYRIEQTLAASEMPNKRWLTNIATGLGYMSYQKRGPTNDFDASDFTTRVVATLDYQVSRRIGVFVDAQMKTTEYFYEEAQGNEDQETKRVYEPSYNLGGRYRLEFFDAARIGAGLLVGQTELQNVIVEPDKTLTTSKLDLQQAMIELSGGWSFTNALTLASTFRLAFYEKSANFPLEDGDYNQASLDLTYAYAQSHIGMSLKHEETKLKLEDSGQQESTSIDLEENSILLNYGLDL